MDNPNWKMAEIEWNYEEFTCFLLIYVSHVDLEFSEHEKKRIEKICSQSTFNKMITLFNDTTDYRALDYILKYKDLYYPTEDEKQKLLENIKQQFHADGDYTDMEKTLLQFLDKMM